MVSCCLDDEAMSTHRRGKIELLQACEIKVERAALLDLDRNFGDA
jgi:hypothetical protein